MAGWGDLLLYHALTPLDSAWAVEHSHSAVVGLAKLNSKQQHENLEEKNLKGADIYETMAVKYHSGVARDL